MSAKKNQKRNKIIVITIAIALVSTSIVSMLSMIAGVF